MPNAQGIDFTAYYESLKAMHGPYSKKDIPRANIDYHGLIAYARESGRRVTELSDEETNRFISGTTIEQLRKVRLG